MPAVAGTKRGNLLRIKPQNLVVEKDLNFSRTGQADWSIEEMCRSILADPERGVRDAIGVERIYPDAENGEARFKVVKGFRRALGAQMAAEVHDWDGLVPAMQWEGDETERVVDNLMENDQREEITPFGRLACYEKLADLGLSVAEISRRTARAKDFIGDHLKLREAPPAVREALQEGKVSWGVVRQVLRVESEKQEAALRDLQGKTVIEARHHVSRAKRGKAVKTKDGGVFDELLERIEARREDRRHTKAKESADYDDGYESALTWVERVVGLLQ